MNTRACVYYSNRLEQLFTFLKEQLFEEKGIFDQRLLVLPSQSMQRHIMLGLATDPEYAVAMGVESVLLPQALSRLTGGAKHLALSALAIHIEGHIRVLLESESKDPLWEPLVHYLMGKHTSYTQAVSSVRFERRLLALCDRLAELFRQYSLFAQEHVDKWRHEPLTHWQQALWLKIFGPEAAYCDEGRLMKASQERLPTLSSHSSIHVFAFSFLSRTILDLFLSVSQHRNVHFYLLSPCQAFWTDIRSDRESWRLQEYWRKEKAPLAQQRDLSDFLADRNPLLANFGRLGREMALYVEEAELEVYEAYQAPAELESLDCYSDTMTTSCFFTETAHAPSLLEHVQGDLLFLRTPSAQDPLLIQKEDQSVQIHSFSSRYREVQGLYEMLLGLIDRHKREETPICPADIVVMAPHIADYGPYIEAVFGAENSQLPYRLLDVPLEGQGSLVPGFLSLLSLRKGRWELMDLLRLFEHVDFRRRQQLSLEDVAQWKKWLKGLGLSWGVNASHREQLLVESQCSQGPSESYEEGSWDFILSRLVQSLVTLDVSDSSTEELQSLPGGSVEVADAELLGRLEILIRSLHGDISFLSPGRSLPIAEWVRFLLCLVDNYFSFDPTDSASSSEWEALKASIASLVDSAGEWSQQEVPFESIEHRLRAELLSDTGSRHESCVQAVSFCSLLPMRAIPSAVIVFMGMDDASYPRQEDSQSLNLMLGWKEVDYCPSRIDFDRYLFLESLLSARRYLLMTYQGYVEEKEVLPCLMVAELQTYINKVFSREAEETPLPVIKHPFHAYDQSYFDKSRALPPVYSPLYYKMATALQHKDKAPAHRFLTSKKKDQEAIKSHEELIDLADLRTLARNPLKLYFQRHLEFSLRSKENFIEAEKEPFHLSHLLRARLRRQSLERSDVLKRAELEGVFPPSSFGSLAREDLIKELNEQQSSLFAWGVDKQSLMDWELHTQCQSPEQLDTHYWRLPAISVDVEGNHFKLVGKLRSVCPQGLLSMGGAQLADQLKAWPEYLVFLHIIESGLMSAAPHLLMLRSGERLEGLCEDPKQSLKDYISYYLRASQEPSPLLPEWVPEFLKADPRFMDRDVRACWSMPWTPFYNHYAIWAFDSSESLSMGQLYQPWIKEAESLFHPLCYSRSK